MPWFAETMCQDVRMGASPRRRAPRATGGRPPVDRVFQIYKVRLQSATCSTIDQQAAEVGVTRGVYMRLVLALAHATPWSPLDLDSTLPLPVAIPSDQLIAATAALTADDTRLPRGGVVTTARIEADLGSLIEDRADAIGAGWSPYISTVLEIAAGAHPAAPAHQPPLPDLGGSGPFADRPISAGEARMAC